MLAVISDASWSVFSMLWSMSHSSFLGPNKPYQRWKRPVSNTKYDYHTIWILLWNTSYQNIISTFFGFNPCRKTCSTAMKKCWRGIWSESSCLPNLTLESMTSRITSFNIFIRLLLSMATGSLSEKSSKVKLLIENYWKR